MEKLHQLYCDEDLTALQGMRFGLSDQQEELAEIVLSEDKGGPNMMEKVFRNDQGEWELSCVRVRSEEVRKMATDVYNGDGSPLDGEWN